MKNPKLEIRNNKELLQLITDEVNVKEINFDVSQEDEAILDTDLTDSLRKEGAARDLIRHIQAARKKAGLTLYSRSNGNLLIK